MARTSPPSQYENHDKDRIAIRDVDRSNWFQCTQLAPTEEQKDVFPWSVVHWLAESKYETSYRPMAIYAGETLVGFAVYGKDPEDGSYWIVALLIDEKFQRRGYGKAAVLALVDLMHQRHSCNQITVGHRRENTAVAALYESVGFRQVLTHPTVDDSAEVLRQLAIG